MTNLKHYIDDDESGRFFDRSAYVQMMDDVENGKVGIVIMKDMTRWGARLSPSRKRDGSIPQKQREVYRNQ